MQKRNILAAVAVAGVVAAAGSAFTATSTIDQATKTVGATSQTISGVAVSAVSYDWVSATDTTNGVTFTIDQALGSNDNMAVSLDGSAGTCGIPVGNTYTCTFSPGVVNARSLSIVVN